ncbi:hypothetical protein STEG23_007913 [Scotinomys teguina]
MDKMTFLVPAKGYGWSLMKTCYEGMVWILELTEGALGKQNWALFSLQAYQRSTDYGTHMCHFTGLIPEVGKVSKSQRMGRSAVKPISGPNVTVAYLKSQQQGWLPQDLHKTGSVTIAHCITAKRAVVTLKQAHTGTAFPFLPFSTGIVLPTVGLSLATSSSDQVGGGEEAESRIKTRDAVVPTTVLTYGSVVLTVKSCMAPSTISPESKNDPCR